MFKNRPAFLTSVLFGSGIFLAAFLNLSVRFSMIYSSLILLLLLISHVISRNVLMKHFFLVCLVVCLGFLRFQMEIVEKQDPDNLTNLNIFDSYSVLEGWIEDPDYYIDGSVKVITNPLSVKVKDRIYFPSSGKVLINLKNQKKELKYGDKITVSGFISRPPGERNPGGFDYAEYLERNEVFAELNVPSGMSYDIYESEHGNVLFKYIILPLRDYLSGIIENYHSGQELEFLRAVLLGQRTGLERETLNSFKETGTFHILAVSGLHVGFIFFILYVLFSFLYLPNKIKYSLLFAVIIFYMFITGLRPPIMRAGIFIVIYLFGICIQKRRDTLNIIGATTLMILMIDPGDLFDPGFQLSVSAVLGINYLSNIYNNMMSETRFVEVIKNNTLIFRIFQFIILSFGAFFGTSLLLAYHFNFLAPVSVILSILYIPVTGIIVGLGFFELLFNGLGQWLISIFSEVNDFFIANLIQLNKIISGFDWINLSIARDELIYVLFCVLLFLFVMSSVKKDIRHKWKLILSVTALFTLYGILFNTPQRNLKMTFLDVGNADAAVISFPDGSNWLIDGGDAWETGDSGESVIIPFLRSAGIRHLNGILITHPNIDHLGGIKSVVRKVKVDTLYEAVDSDNFNIADEMNRNALERNIPKRLVKQGDRIGSGDLFRIYILSPGPDNNSSSINDRSMVLLIKYGEVNILLTGDISSMIEKDLVNDLGSLLKSDVLKIAHHGSVYSSDTQFIEYADPRYAVISAGRNNPFGHPSENTIENLQKRDIQIFRTDIMGAIVLISDGENIWITGKNELK
ncbi:DNA internalization-related competence protein ComEC/Rec2 [candidate division KSB1 bacterium]